MAILAALALLPGCRAISDVAGVAAAAASGSASGNPAVGIAVGIAVRAGVDEVRKYVSRRRQQGEQDAIADAAGSAPIGQPRAWEIRHTIPIGNERGQLAAVREWATPLTTCREVLFTVVDGQEHEPFTTTLCRNGPTWKWAAAEPAVERWGFLQ
jgi:hypothetical protein